MMESSTVRAVAANLLVGLFVAVAGGQASQPASGPAKIPKLLPALAAANRAAEKLPSVEDAARVKGLAGPFWVKADIDQVVFDRETGVITLTAHFEAGARPATDYLTADERRNRGEFERAVEQYFSRARQANEPPPETFGGGRRQTGGGGGGRVAPGINGGRIVPGENRDEHERAVHDFRQAVDYARREMARRLAERKCWAETVRIELTLPVGAHIGEWASRKVLRATIYVDGVSGRENKQFPQIHLSTSPSPSCAGGEPIDLEIPERIAVVRARLGDDVGMHGSQSRYTPDGEDADEAERLTE